MEQQPDFIGPEDPRDYEVDRPSLFGSVEPKPLQPGVKHEVTEKHIMTACIGAALGTPEVVIAMQIGISRMTLRRHYSVQLQYGREFIKTAVGSKLVEAALKGDVRAIEFYLTRNAGWRDPDRAAQLEDRNKQVELPLVPMEGDEKPQQRIVIEFVRANSNIALPAPSHDD